MTAFPDWPAPHRVCAYCMDYVSLEGALSHPDIKKWSNWTLHPGGCAEEWAKMTITQQAEYHSKRAIFEEAAAVQRSTQHDELLDQAHKEWVQNYYGISKGRI